MKMIVMGKALTEIARGRPSALCLLSPCCCSWTETEATHVRNGKKGAGTFCSVMLNQNSWHSYWGLWKGWLKYGLTYQRTFILAGFLPCHGISGKREQSCILKRNSQFNKFFGDIGESMDNCGVSHTCCISWWFSPGFLQRKSLLTPFHYRLDNKNSGK